MRWQWVDARVSSDILSLNSPHKIIFDYITSPSLSSVSPTCYWNTDHVLMSQGGAVYQVDIQLELLYQNATNVPASVELRDSDEVTVLKSFKTHRALDTTNAVITCFKCVFTISSSNIQLKTYLVNTANIASIGANSCIHVRRLV